jgi:hypothetical protein
VLTTCSPQETNNIRVCTARCQLAKASLALTNYQLLVIPLADSSMVMDKPPSESAEQSEEDTSDEGDEVAVTTRPGTVWAAYVIRSNLY